MRCFDSNNKVQQKFRSETATVLLFLSYCARTSIPDLKVLENFSLDNSIG